MWKKPWIFLVMLTSFIALGLSTRLEPQGFTLARPWKKDMMIRLRRGSTINLHQTDMGNPRFSTSNKVFKWLRLKKFYPNTLIAENQLDVENKNHLDLYNDNLDNDYSINDLHQAINDIEDNTNHNLLDTNNKNQDDLVQKIIKNLWDSVNELPENANIESLDASSTEKDQSMEKTIRNSLIQSMYDYILQNPKIHENAREGIKANSICSSTQSNNFMRLKKGSLWYITCKHPSNNILENPASELSNDILYEPRNQQEEFKRSYMWLNFSPKNVDSTTLVPKDTGIKPAVTLLEDPSKTNIGNPKHQTSTFTRYNMLRLKKFYSSSKKQTNGFLGYPRNHRSAFPGYTMLRLKKSFTQNLMENKPEIEMNEPETSLLPKRVKFHGIEKVAMPWLSKYFKSYRYTTPSKKELYELNEPEISLQPKEALLPVIEKLAVPWLSKYFKSYRYTTPSKKDPDNDQFERQTRRYKSRRFTLPQFLPRPQAYFSTSTSPIRRAYQRSTNSDWWNGGINRARSLIWRQAFYDTDQPSSPRSGSKFRQA